jgi:polyisoprenoid-binding protein YceI
MNTKYFSTLIVCLMVASAGCIGCGNPAEDVSKATVNEAVPVEPASAPETAEAPAAAEAPVEAPAVTGVVYAVKPLASDITFTGTKKPGISHSGGWSAYSGAATVPEGDFTKAQLKLVIDMKTTNSDDKDLTDKLVSDLFFDIEKYPTSEFVSTGIEKADDGYNMSGNLALKGVTKNITIPVTIEMDDETLYIEAEFSINRKLWGIDYDGLADAVIYDDVLVTFAIEAKVEAA